MRDLLPKSKRLFSFLILLILVVSSLLKQPLVPVVKAQTPRPLKYFGADTVNPGDLATLSQYNINTAVVAMNAYGSQSSWQAFFPAGSNINIVVWPLGGSGACGFPYNGTDITPVHGLLDYLGTQDRFIGIVNAHEPSWSCPMTIEEMATIRTRLKDYVNGKFGRDIKVWNYIDNITDSIPDGDIGRIMDVADTWEYCFNGENTCQGVLNRINQDRARIDNAGLDGRVDLVYSFPTFEVSIWRMPTADEMYNWGCQMLRTNALDGFFWYTWRNPAGYTQTLADRSDLWPTMSRVYNDCVNKDGIPPTSTPTPPGGPSLTPTPTTPASCPRKSEGDANCDGKIDGIDYSLWLNSQCRPSSTQGCASIKADFNNDGNIDDEDYNIWFKNRETGTTPTPTSTPPPNATSTPTPTLPPRATPTLTPTPGSPPTGGLEFYGVEFASTGDFPTLRDQLSVNTVLMSFSPGAGCASWTETLDNAASYGIKLIPILGWKADECNPSGGGGPVWSYSGDRKNAANGSWNLTSSGESFLSCMQNYLSGGGQGLAAVYGLHESYWMGTTACGYGTDVQQELYSEIKSRCSLCKVYSEVGNLYFWETNNEYGGPWSRIQNGAFDYAGIWLYPFNGEGLMSDAQRVIVNDRSLINSKGLSIKLVFLMQTFGAGGYRMPLATEMHDLGCMVLNSKKVEGALWYTWRGGPYTDYLANHPDYYSVSRSVLNNCGR